VHSQVASRAGALALEIQSEWQPQAPSELQNQALSSQSAWRGANETHSQGSPGSEGCDAVPAESELDVASLAGG
jgi:hypothetical protein